MAVVVLLVFPGVLFTTGAGSVFGVVEGFLVVSALSPTLIHRENCLVMKLLW